MIEQILKIFTEKLSRPVSSPEEDLFESGALDSMVLVELLLELEQSLGVTIPIADLDIDSVRTVRSIAELAEAATKPVAENVAG
ncbi:MAG: phosphopantetheine-binding protein [Bryobacteraceae bacterium]|nr:phosphopantetheine-binding protein [Bryobacteraceae bacterium]